MLREGSVGDLVAVTGGEVYDIVLLAHGTGIFNNGLLELIGDTVRSNFGVATGPADKARPRFCCGG